MTAVQQPKATPSEMKTFFSTPERPLSNTELIDFKKTDQAGYDELAHDLAAHLAK